MNMIRCTGECPLAKAWKRASRRGDGDISKNVPAFYALSAHASSRVLKYTGEVIALLKSEVKQTLNMLTCTKDVWLGRGAGGGAESGGVGLGLLWLCDLCGGAEFVALVFQGGADERRE